ncbi:hypothetical protein JCM4814A_30910 [Streptomyces phaeofaciens JCM 4814]|uniref:Secreted protein n=1 Tax=Streptomyces phaeofaciens TaxID=68254 RepID=A0A918LY75_9ACTN|nr:hypothetical protein [Streptomyces phaeofaciens]GGT67279.1 hypothetical protein GCM10010226_51360 [Streptomyces phaeofaciens]
MNPLQKIGAFTAALGAAFGAAYGVGAVTGPVGSDPAPAAHGEPHEPAASTPRTLVPAGLQVSEGGHTLDLRTTALTAGRPGTLEFVVRDAHGEAVTRYRTAHGKQLHLIVASRDLTTYRHLHPTRTADGTWSTPVDLPAAGAYRVFADFVPAGAREGLTLGSDLTVTGRYTATAMPAPASTTTVDGYTVTLDGALSAGGESDLTFTVRDDSGTPVTALQPYLGSYGHLVALRSGDLAYLHVHPHDEAGTGTAGGPAVSFTAATPSTGTYRLFLDFKVAGEVHTASFTAEAGTDGH